MEFAPGLHVHASGALWVAAARAVLVADTHLGYAWAQRRRGDLGPLVDGGTREKLESLAEELQPREFVLLGDIVHAPQPLPEEQQFVEETLASLASRATLTVVRGNHDRAFARDYAHLSIPLVEQWTGSGVLALHGDRLPDDAQGQFVVLGHVHPVVLIHDSAGASRRVPVFVIGKCGAVLPAFSPFSTGFVVNGGMPPEVRQVLGPERLVAIAATGRRLVRLAPAALA